MRSHLSGHVTRRCREENVVSVEEDDDVARRLGVAGVHRRRLPAVVFEDAADAGKAIDECNGVVGGPVVDDDYFDVGRHLTEGATDRRGQELRIVVIENNDAHQHLGNIVRWCQCRWLPAREHQECPGRHRHPAGPDLRPAFARTHVEDRARTTVAGAVPAWTPTGVRHYFTDCVSRTARTKDTPSASHTSPNATK